MPKGQYTRVEGKHYGRPKGSKSKPKETEQTPAPIVQDNTPTSP